jgi:hypothetical protein
VRSDAAGLVITVTGEAVSAYLQARDNPVSVELLGPAVRVSTTVEVSGERSDASAEGRLRLRDGALRFRPSRVEVEGAFEVRPAALTFEVPLPELVAGLTYEGLEVSEGMAEIRASASDASFQVRP